VTRFLTICRRSRVLNWDCDWMLVFEAVLSRVDLLALPLALLTNPSIDYKSAISTRS
jgi:hypothetical protein